MSNFRSLQEFKFPQRYNVVEWKNENRQHLNHAEEQCKLAERIRAESSRIQRNTGGILERNKQESNTRLRERINQAEYRKEEIEKTTRNIQLELEPVGVIKRKVLAGIQYLESCGYQITTKCLYLREGRLGIDLVHDDVEKELLREKKTIESCLNILKRSLEQVEETERELRACIYFLNKDLQGKINVLSIDNSVLHMKETDGDLYVYEGTDNLDLANVSFDEWEKYTDTKFLNVNKKLNKSRTLRTYIDTVLKQVEQDLKNQDRAVLEMFRRRIEEVKLAKGRLENQHFETVRQAKEMANNIAELQKDAAGKEAYLALAHTRLGKRAQRPGVELVRDNANISLNNETVDVQEILAQLRLTIAQSEATQRQLLKTQVQLEEDINIKMNSLKIDEVDCMTLRQSVRHPEL